MKKLSLTGLAVGAALAVLVPGANAAIGIVGSAHDFYNNTNTWINGITKPVSGNSTNVCSECHTIHHAANPANGPLWAHKASSQTYITYASAGSETFDALGLTVALGTSSKACLSCHDGTVGINEKTSLVMDGSGTATSSIAGGTAVVLDDAVIAVNGNDLTHTHPIGVSYDSAQAALPAGELKDKTGTFPNTTGSPTIAQMLKGANKTQMECSTCHDIHRTRGNAPNSGIYTVASGQNLCMGCHNK
jgi:predicted CXXCH cytochrome family protein